MYDGTIEKSRVKHLVLNNWDILSFILETDTQNVRINFGPKDSIRPKKKKKKVGLPFHDEN